MQRSYETLSAPTGITSFIFPTPSCFMHIRDLGKIGSILDFKTESTTATSIRVVHKKFDHCNLSFRENIKGITKKLPPRIIR